MRFSDWKDKFYFIMLAFLVGGALTFFSWITTSINRKPDREETLNLIENQSPYVKDRQLIQDHLRRMEILEGKLTVVIEKNTDAINLLQVSLASLKVLMDSN